MFVYLTISGVFKLDILASWLLRKHTTLESLIPFLFTLIYFYSTVHLKKECDGKVLSTAFVQPIGSLTKKRVKLQVTIGGPAP